MITVNKANPTAAEERTSLVNASDGSGLHFDGSAGNIDIASPPDLGTKFSFEFVIKADSTGSSDKIIDFGDGGRFVIEHGTSGLQVKPSNAGGWVTLQSPSPLADLEVHHLVLTVDGTTATLFDNGNQTATATISATDIDSCADAKIGSYFDSATDLFNGTIYRARFYNRALSADDVRTAFERSDVPVADQYGSQTNKISAAVDKNWGTNQADTSNDTNDRATFNGNYVWNSSGSMTNISVASNVLQFTATTGAGMYYPTTLNAGEKYRVTLATGTISGTFAVRTYNGSSYDNHGTLSASTTNSIEFTAPATTENYLYIQATSAGTIQINAASVSNEIVRVGCVSDYDLAFANPKNSFKINDRSGAADGTASNDGTNPTGISQVQVIKQLNATAARIGTVAATPADGELMVSGNVSIADDQYYQWGGTNARIVGSHSGDYVKILTGNSAKLTVDSTGLATFSNGINLGDTTLSNYAEGTWTPTVGGDATYSAQTGRYTRVGRLVTATFDLTINVIGTGSTYIVSGLPFNSASGESIGAGGNINYYASLAISPVLFAPTVAGSTVHIRSATSAASSPSNHGLLGNAARIAGIVTYTV